MPADSPAPVSGSGERVLRVFFDHGHSWPLWESGDKVTMERTDYGFSPEHAVARRAVAAISAEAPTDVRVDASVLDL